MGGFLIFMILYDCIYILAALEQPTTSAFSFRAGHIRLPFLF